MILQLLFAFSLLPIVHLLIHSGRSNHTLFEGDIVMDEWLFGRLLLNKTASTMQNVAVSYQDRLWPNGSVPYILSANFSKLEKEFIEHVMLEFSYFTCITFHQRNLESKYINIIKSDFFCQSYIGFQNKMQEVWLSDSCIERNTILHELMHALGFFHEHTRHDRDDYIEILNHNIIPSQKHNFDKINKVNTTNFNTEYDFKSVMHYKPFDFSMNGSLTIRVKLAGSEIKAEGLSKIDILKINRLYNCSRNERQLTDKPTTMTEVPCSTNCEFTLTAEKDWKHFHSHFTHDYNYENNLFCKWKIQNSKSQRVKINFQEFDLEHSTGCTADRLEIFYSLAGDPRLIKEILCGPTIPSEIEYDTALLGIYFITNHNVTSKGFKLSFKSIDVVGCNHLLIADNKPRNLYSNNAQNRANYNDNISCKWTIRAINSKNVFFMLGDMFELEYDAYCSNDYVELCNTVQDSDGGIPCVRYCGHRTDKTISFKSLKDTAVIHFHTNSNINYRGFHFIYFAGPPIGGFEKCGSTLIADDNVRQLYSHPGGGNYENNVLCSWRIRAGNGMHVKLMVPSFHLENHTSCNFDYFEVYDGPNNRSKIFGKFCGTVVRRMFVSSGQDMCFVFRTDGSTSNKGFWLAYFETL